MLRHCKRRRQGRTWGCPRLGFPSWEGAAVLGLCPREAPVTAWSPHTTSVAAVLLQEKGLPVPQAQYREISANLPLPVSALGSEASLEPISPSGPRARSTTHGRGARPRAAGSFQQATLLTTGAGGHRPHLSWSSIHFQPGPSPFLRTRVFKMDQPTPCFTGKKQARPENR